MRRELIGAGVLLAVGAGSFALWKENQAQPEVHRVVSTSPPQRQPDAGADAGESFDAGATQEPAVDDWCVAFRAQARALISGAAADAGQTCARVFAAVEPARCTDHWVLEVTELVAEADRNPLDGAPECRLTWTNTLRYRFDDGAVLPPGPAPRSANIEETKFPARAGGSGSKKISRVLELDLNPQGPAALSVETTEDVKGSAPIHTVYRVTGGRLEVLDLGVDTTGAVVDARGAALLTGAPYDHTRLFSHHFRLRVTPAGEPRWEEGATREWCPTIPALPQGPVVDFDFEEFRRWADLLVCARLWGASSAALSAHVNARCSDFSDWSEPGHTGCPEQLFDLIDLEPPFLLER